MDKPITFTVDRIRDGKSFTTRTVKAIQDGEAIFSCSVSFQKDEDGLEHQIEMSDFPTINIREGWSDGFLDTVFPLRYMV